MAGVKGKSGGPRKNAGGARPGAGRKPKEKPAPVPLDQDVANLDGDAPFDPRPALEQIARGLMEVPPQQFKALTLLMPYGHTKKGDGGKKDEQADKAKKAAGGKFAPVAAPRLAAANGKKL